MKQTTLKLMLASIIVLAVIALPVQANPGITVDPSTHDFGEVELGTSATTEITVYNMNGHAIEVYDVSLQPGGGDFSITAPATFPLMIDSGESVIIEIAFTPIVIGLSEAVLEIVWTNGENGVSSVDLQGTGIAAGPPPSQSIAEILAFYDESIEAGTIQGGGEGWLAVWQSRLFRGMIVMSGRLIERGNLNLACLLLNRAYLRSDGQDFPVDFIKGQGVPMLNCMILQLIADLGCI